MTTYAEVDATIEAWARAHLKTLFTEWDGQPARFGFLSGLRPFESFQIVVFPLSTAGIVVEARSVDTDDGSSFEQRFEGPTETLSALLAAATEAVRPWINRSPANGG